MKFKKSIFALVIGSICFLSTASYAYADVDFQFEGSWYVFEMGKQSI